MDDKATTKDAAIAQLIELMKEETWLSVRWGDAAAKVIGLHPTDLVLLTFIYEFGPASAGRLAAVADLTTGATTAAINRLERAGFIERKADKNDGRKVTIHPLQIPPAFREIHKSARNALLATLSRYTLAELQVILSSRQQVNTLLRQQIASLKVSA